MPLYNADLAPSVGWKNATAMSPDNETWKIHRKNIKKVVSNNVSLAMFDRVQETESAHFILNVLESPDDLFNHIRKWVFTITSIILNIASKLTNGLTEKPVV